MDSSNKYCILVMGVSGCGKSTIGELLSEKLKLRFIDADSFHSDANKEKMRQGIPLTDSDRIPWLNTLNSEIKAHASSIVIACSALKEAYREILFKSIPHKRIILLNGSQRLLSERLAKRKGHFMNPKLLQSQLDILEWPLDCITIDCEKTPSEQVDEILSHL